MRFLKQIEASDVFQLTGLTLLGVGLFLVYGLGWSLMGSGSIFVLLGFFSNK